MKILFLRFPLKPAWGGAETHTLTLASGLSRQGQEVFLLSNGRRLLEAFARAGLPSKKIWIGWEPTSKAALLLFPLTALVSFFTFGFWLVKLAPDAVICTSLTDKLMVAPIVKILRKKTIWIEHTRLGHWLLQNPLLFWYRLAAKRAKVVAPSYFLRNQLIAAGVPVDRIGVVYPGTEIQKKHVTEANERSLFIPLSCNQERVLHRRWRREVRSPRDGGLKTSATSDKKIIIGYLGRLAKEKGVDVLLKALVTTNNPAVIVGTGPEEQGLKKLAEKLGLNGRVKFLGEIADKQNFFSQIDCLVVPSVKAEAFGLVIIEAMAAGVPVVASRLGAIPEIIEDKKTGQLFAPGDYRQLAALIEETQNNPDFSQTLAKEAEKAAKIRFDRKTMIERFQALLQKNPVL